MKKKPIITYKVYYYNGKEESFFGNDINVIYANAILFAEKNGWDLTITKIVDEHENAFLDPKITFLNY